MTEPESTWRVRMGWGLLSAAPLSDSLREAHAKEDEREREQAERDREMRAQAAVEHAADLRFQGVRPRSREELFREISAAQDRQDRRDAAADERWREQFGRGVTGRPTATELIMAEKAKRVERVARWEAEPVTAGEFRKHKEKFDGLSGDVEDLWNEKRAT